MIVSFLAIIVLGALALFAGYGASRLRRTSLNTTYFKNRWREIQGLLKSAEGMQLSIIEADKLLDDALKELRFNGKTMGERLVSAQRQLSNPNNVWTAHKLRNRLVHKTGLKVTKRQVQSSLQAFRAALKDLGAL